VLGVVSDRGGPQVLRLTAGIAERAVTGEWRYTCPTAWGGPETPLAVALPEGVGVWVSGTRGATILGLDSRAQPVENSDSLSAQWVRDLDADHERAVALVRTREQAELVLLGTAPSVVLELELGWDSVAIEGDDALVAKGEGEEIVIARIPLGGGEIQERRWAIGDEIDTVELRGLHPEGRYVLSRGPDAHRLLLLGDLAEEIYSGQEAIHGPAAVGSRRYIVSGGTLIDVASESL